MLLEQAFVNLLENAFRHTPPGTKIVIGGKALPQAVSVEISNNGPQFSNGDEERIFDKFYRPDHSQSQGFGLGLTICRAILEAHGGTIRAENNRNGGVSFIMILPNEENPPEVPGE